MPSPRAKVLAKALDAAVGKYLDARKNPSPKVSTEEWGRQKRPRPRRTILLGDARPMFSGIMVRDALVWNATHCSVPVVDFSLRESRGLRVLVGKLTSRGWRTRELKVTERTPPLPQSVDLFRFKQKHRKGSDAQDHPPPAVRLPTATNLKSGAVGVFFCCPAC